MINKKISVIFPCFNVAEYVLRSYKSVVEQEYFDIEIIYVNDCSNDLTLSRLREIEVLDKRVIIIDLKENVGTFHARKKGFENSSGDFIFFMDPDDEIKKGFFEKVLDLYEYNNPDIIFCKIKTLPNNIFSKKISVPKNSVGEELIKNCIDKLSLIPKGNGGKVYKRSVVCESFEKLSFIDKRFVFAEDVVFFFSSLLSCEKISSIDDYLYLYHKNNNSITQVIDVERLLFNISQIEYAIFSLKRLMQVKKSYIVEKSCQILIDSLVYDKMTLLRKIDVLEGNNYQYFLKSLKMLKKKFYISNFIKLLIFLFSFSKKKFF